MKRISNDSVIDVKAKETAGSWLRGRWPRARETMRREAREHLWAFAAFTLTLLVVILSTSKW